MNDAARLYSALLPSLLMQCLGHGLLSALEVLELPCPARTAAGVSPGLSLEPGGG